MTTFKFDKTFQQRFDDFKMFVEDEGSDMDTWREFMESALEPAGYGAIWKLSKADCEKNEVKFPCEVFGIVQETFFEEFAVLFLVESVEDDSVHLPEVCRVPFEDIYPCREQENAALNVDLTADCMDRYHFFFKYIFFPWDSDLDQVKKEIHSRMQLFYDLKNKNLSKGLSSHIRQIMAEAKYIQSKREQIEISMDDVDADISGESKDVARNLLELHLRLMKIKHEVEILLNPEMREIYEEIKFPHHAIARSNEPNIFAVSKPSRMSEMKQFIEDLSQKVAADQKVHWMSLQDAFAAASVSSEIYLSTGNHSVNFMEFLNDKIMISGLTNKAIDFEKMQNYAKLSAEDFGSFLFAIDAGFRMQNLIIDCDKVKTGFLIKNGKVVIKNCVIYGSKDSSVTEGFAVSGAAEVRIENCLIFNFATGISISDSANVMILNSVIKNCNNGVLIDNESQLSMEKSSILNCNESGIFKFTTQLDIKTSFPLDENKEQETAK